MPMRWQFKGEAPASFKMFFALFGINFAGQAAAFYAIPRWSPIRSDAAHFTSSASEAALSISFNRGWENTSFTGSRRILFYSH